MAQRGKATTAVAAMALWLTFAAPAHADLLGGVTELIDETSEAGVGLLDGVVDAGPDAIDDTLGSTGTSLENAVVTVTEAVGTSSEELTGALGSTADAVTEVIDDGGDAVAGSDPSTPAVPTTAPRTSTLPPSSEPTSATPTSTSSRNELTAGLADSPAGRAMVTGPRSPAGSSPRVDADGHVALDELRVLAVTNGFTREDQRPVVANRIDDSSLYGRLLGWLTSTGSALRVLAAPLLGFEILVRALLSAGSGLVAPLSLLAAFVFRMLREGRRPTSASSWREIESATVQSV